MRAAIKKRDFLIVAAIAILVEGILAYVGSHQHADHTIKSSLIYLFHFPGLVLVDLMHIPDPERSVIVCITGAVQLFIVFFTGWVILKQICGRHDA
jgi:hypothetical protein